MIQGLKKNLLALKEKTDNNGYDKLNKKLKNIIDELNSSEQQSMEDLGYLLDLAGLYRQMALKISKFLWFIVISNGSFTINLSLIIKCILLYYVIMIW